MAASQTTGASIVAVIDGLDITDLGSSHGESPQLHIKIFVDDGKEPVMKLGLDNRNSTYQIPQPVKLDVNPSSILKVVVYRKSRMRVGNRLVGHISNRISELVTVIEPSPRRLSEKDHAAGYIQIRLRIDTSGSRTVDQLGLERASRVLENAHRRLEERKGDQRVFNATSGVIDQGVGYADAIQSGYSEAQKASDSLGLLGEALINLDKFVQLMDGLASAHPMVQCAWTVLSFVYKALKQQLEQDAHINTLARQLRDVLAYAQECRDLKAIKDGTDTIREMGRLVVEGGSLIDECMRHGFLSRAAKSALSSDLENRIQQCERELKMVKEIFRTTLDIRNFQHNQGITRDQVLEWLCPGRFDGRHTSIRESRSENTGHWIVDALEGNHWTTEKGVLLIGTGDPGIGKTYLCSFVIDHMLSLRAQQNYGVAYFYFSVDRANEQSLHHVLSSLAKQLTAQTKPLVDEVERLYKTSQDGKTTPTSDELKTTMSSIVKAETFSHVFLVFDAFDECNAELRSSFLSLFERMTHDGINVFVTSRPNVQEIQSSPSNATTISLSAKEHDLRTYLQKRIDQNRLLANVVSDYHRDGGEDVIAVLIEIVNGMFLFADFCAGRLQGVGTPDELIEELRDLRYSSGSGDYSAMYKSIIDRIRQQPDRSKQLAIRTLCWLVKSWRALSIQELQIAVSVKPGQSALAIGALQPPERLMEVCAGLVVMDKATDSVRLSHATAREYILQTPGILSPDPNWVLVETCATYLSFDVFKAGACTTREDFYSRFLLHPFLRYAADHITRHSRICDEHLSTDVVLKFFEHEGSLSSWLQALDSDGWWLGFDGYPTKHGALHAACRIGHEGAVRRLIERVVVMKYDNQPTSLLRGGANTDNGAVAEPFVGVAELAVQDSWGMTPLHLAAENGHEAIAKLLVEKGAELSVEDRYEMTPLHLAAQNGHEAIAKLLVEKGAELSVQDHLRRTPLLWAAKNGHEAIAKLLVEKGAEVSVKDIRGKTPLHRAARRGHEAIAKLFVEKGAELSVQDYGERTPLHRAAENGHEAIAKLLVEKGAELSVRDISSSTPLHRAAANDHEAIAKLLVENGAELSLQDNRGLTPLHRASWFGHEMVARLLVEKGAELSLQDNDGDTPLLCAARKGHESIAKLLIDKGADLFVKNSDGDTALLAAAKNGHEGIVKLLGQS